MAGPRRFFVVDGSKVCTRCLQTKPISEFHSRRAGTKVRAECRNCARHLNRLHKYGVDAEAYAQLLSSQGGKCAICRSLGYAKDEPAILEAASRYLQGGGVRKAV